jgi:hypothetical protein
VGRATWGIGWRRACLALLAGLAVGLLGGGAPGVPLAMAERGSAGAPGSGAASADSDLAALINDVAGATGSRYGLVDDRGRSMDTAKVIWVPEAWTFAAVYHTFSNADRRFHVQLATSDDLLTWTWRTELAASASQPTIAAASDGGYVVAWEQGPDPLHVALLYYPTWQRLLSATPERRMDLPVTTPACGEGTPSIEAASSGRVDLGFHYHADCRRDREAEGTTDWSAWQTRLRPEVDRAVQAAGAGGNIGDRDEIAFEGRDLTLIEGQLQPDQPATWRTFLYDPQSAEAELLEVRTRHGSVSVANPTISRVPLGGGEAIVVTLFLFGEGSRDGEGGELIYYRMLQDPP